jgi:hypothetical protein
MSNLNDAIQLIRQGQKWEAQRILQELIKAEPQNIPAWFWYVETCTTTERRIQVLETCLKMNPGNNQVEQALQKIRGSQPPMPTPAPPKAAPPVYSYQDGEPNKDEDLYGYNTFHSDLSEQPKSSYFEEEKPVAYNKNSYGYESDSQPVKAKAPQKQAWEVDPSTYEDNSMLSKPKKVQRSYSTFDVWMTAVTSQDERSYADLLQDPEMGVGRAFTWSAIAGLVGAIVVPIQLMMTPDLSELLARPEIRQAVGGSVNQGVLIIMITIAALILSPIGSVINLAIFGGLQHVLAMFFGGGGNYTRTVYALAAFLAPMTMVTSLIAIVPVVGGCLSLPLAIYNFVLNVRALKAAHSLTNGAAVGVILAPSLLILLFICLFVFMSGTSLPTS